MTESLFLIPFLFSGTSFANDSDVDSFVAEVLSPASSQVEEAVPEEEPANTSSSSSSPSRRRDPATLGDFNGNKTSDTAPPSPELIDLNNEINKLDSKAAKKDGGESQGSFSSGASASGPSVSARDRKQLIMKTIADNYPELKSCYRQGLKKEAHLKEGKVVMGWNIDAQGKVAGVEIQSSQLENKEVEKCMTEQLSTWQFPRQAKLSGSKDRMTYTFQFFSERE